jgi:hypothetical protein
MHAQGQPLASIPEHYVQRNIVDPIYRIQQEAKVTAATSIILKDTTSDTCLIGIIGGTYSHSDQGYEAISLSLHHRFGLKGLHFTQYAFQLEHLRQPFDPSHSWIGIIPYDLRGLPRFYQANIIRQSEEGNLCDLLSDQVANGN